MLSAALLLLTPQTTDWPLTRAERTDYAETSTYEDVVQFLQTLEARKAPMRLTWIGESTEARKIPLMIVADPPVKDAAEARASGRVIIYIQGNIHAGEVEGKESAQILLREIAKAHAAKKPTILKQFVLLVNPIYNADGNEKWGPGDQNRPGQDGPAKVGVRPNGQGFDLNRDCIKAESPEMRAALEHIYRPWDPDVVFDLHTTNGTRHGYDMTYATPLHPNTPEPLFKFGIDQMMPAMRKVFQSRYQQDLFDYGNAVRRGETMVWETFGAEARYVTNYAGLTGRLGILSEATSYISFQDRVVATNRFVDACLEYLAEHARQLPKLRKAPLPAELGVRFEMIVGREDEVILEKREAGQPAPKGRPVNLERVKMPVYDRFKISRSARVPRRYYIPGDEVSAVRLLMRHGVTVRKLNAPVVTDVERFEIETKNQAQRAFQGHRLITLEGKFVREAFTVPTGWYVVETDQALGRFAFSMLEPEGDDGLVTWGFFGEELASYPVRKSLP